VTPLRADPPVRPARVTRQTLVSEVAAATTAPSSIKPSVGASGEPIEESAVAIRFQSDCPCSTKRRGAGRSGLCPLMGRFAERLNDLMSAQEGVPRSVMFSDSTTRRLNSRSSIWLRELPGIRHRSSKSKVGQFHLRRVLSIGIGILLAATVLSGLNAGGPAQAASPTSTSLPGLFSSMAVDPVNDEVFVSLPSTGIVEVLDFSGNVLDTITGFGSEDTSQANEIIYANNALYMTDTADGTVDRIDPSTYAVTVLATGLETPSDLVYSAESLWTVSGEATLVSVDITTGLVTSYPNVRLEGTGLASGAGLPDTIFGYNPLSSPEIINKINVQATPTVVTTVDESGGGSYPYVGDSEMAVSPDGSHLLAGPIELNTSDLTGSGIVYPGGYTVTGNSMTSANGGLFAAGLSGEEIAGAPSLVTVYPMDDPNDPLVSLSFPSPPASRGLSFSPDGDLLFVVTAGIGFEAPEQFQVENIASSVGSPPQSTPPPPAPSSGTGGGGSTARPTQSTISVNNAASATITVGTDATFTEVGLPTTATGSVSFGANGETICAVSLSGLANEAISCSSSPSLGVGTYVVTAAFVDTDGSYLGSTSSNSVTLTVDPASPPSATTSPTTTTTSPVGPKEGYDLVGSDGGIFTFGAALFYGSTGSLTLQRPVTGITPTSDHGGYWLVASDGGIFTFGDAGFYGSIPGLGLAPAGSSSSKRLNAPIVGMVPSTDGGGYFMVAADGGVFAFGDAKFEGSCPSIGGCSGAAVAVMPDASGDGYWLVTSTGRVYAFGDAASYGAPGPQSVPVTSAVRTTDGAGYWILFADGVVDAYGDATDFGGPTGSVDASDPATTIFTTSDGGGYWVASADGSVFTYGDAPYEGGTSGMHLNGPIIAATGW
jgi:hypothetical protein